MDASAGAEHRLAQLPRDRTRRRQNLRLRLRHTDHRDCTLFRAHSTHITTLLLQVIECACCVGTGCCWGGLEDTEADLHA